MNSAEQNFPDEPQAQADEVKPNQAFKPGPKQDELKPPPDRPTLVAPPPRPVRPERPKPTKPIPAPPPPPAVAKATVAQATLADGLDTEEALAVDRRYLPIAPPSEPMQYRAIGLVRGIYAPTEADQLNRGNLTTEDGQVIDSVLLGRVTSLVKKHIDLTTSHLWVVYPRTRREMEAGDDQDLHLQIVGIWEPETLGLPGESPATTEASATTTVGDDKTSVDDQEVKPVVLPADLPTVDDNFFSIRGEVVKYSPEDQEITVKILQGVKKTPGAPKSFKLCLKGTIEGRTLGYFWDFKVKREAKTLVVQKAAVVGIVPPKKRPKGGSRRGAPNRRPGGSRPVPSRMPSGAQGSLRPRKPGSAQG